MAYRKGMVSIKARRPGDWHVHGTDLGLSGLSTAPLWLKVGGVFAAAFGFGYWLGRR
jgi:hypothetical protein